MIRRILTVAACALALGSGVARATIVIDSWDTPASQTVSDAAGGGPTSSSVASANSLGGFRELSSDAAVGSGLLNADVNVSPADFRFNVPLTGFGVVSILWDGDVTAGNQQALGSFDLTESGANDRFILTLDTFSGTFVTAGIRAFDSDSNFLSAIPISTTGSHTFLFSSFTGVDFTDVSAVQMEFTSTNVSSTFSSQLALVSTAPVPEPSTLAMLAVVPVALVGLRWNRRRKAA